MSHDPDSIVLLPDVSLLGEYNDSWHIDSTRNIVLLDSPSFACMMPELRRREMRYNWVTNYDSCCLNWVQGVANQTLIVLLFDISMVYHNRVTNHDLVLRNEKHIWVTIMTLIVLQGDTWITELWSITELCTTTLHRSPGWYLIE